MATEEKKSKNKIVPGIIFISLGVIFLLNNYGIANIEIGRLWPIFLVIIGVAILFEKKD